MITLEEIRSRLAEPPEADNELLESLKERAIAYLEQQTHRTWGEVAEVVETVRHGYLSAAPVADSLVLEYRTSFGGTWTTIDAADYELDGRRLRLRWPVGMWEVRATYDTGHVAGLQPADVRGAVMDLVALWYEAGGPVLIGESGQEMPHSVQAVINSHRRVHT